MTSNLKYADAFQYTAVEMRDTKQEIEDSDYVLKHLKLAYLQKDGASTNNSEQL